MKDLRFYLEYPDNKEKRMATRKSLGNHSGNCIAIIPETSRQRMDNNVDAFGAVYYGRNSDVASTACSWTYLYERCKRISEQQAREIHPKLFEYLDYEP